MNISNVVQVTISLSTAQVTGLAFGRPNVLAYEGHQSRGTAKVYQTSSWASELVADGYATSDATYKAIQAMMSQPNPPSDFMLSSINTSVVGIFTVTVSGSPSAGTFTINVNGTPVSYVYSSGGTTDIATGLRAAINAANLGVTATGSSSTIIITSNATGVAVTASSNTSNTSGWSYVATQASIDPATQLTALIAAGYGNWYVLASSVPTDTDIMQIAAWAESQGTKRLFIAETATTDCYNSGSTTDVMYLLKAANYGHTGCIFNVANAAGTQAPAWIGYNLAFTPGSNNWAFSQLVGQLPDALTDAQTTAILGKNGNYFVNLNNVNITFKGYVSSGSYVDVTLFLDWFAGQVQVQVFQLFVDQAAVGKKVEYDDGGISQVVSIIKAQGKASVDSGGFSSFTMNQPLASSFSSTVKQTRNLPSLPFSAELGGALDSIQVQGFVTF